MAIPDGKPATDFSAMNREWVRAVAEEAAESGGSGIPAPENPSNGDVLTYSSTDTAWVAAAPAASGIPAPASPSDGDVLTYDSTTSAWVAAAPSGGGGGLLITKSWDEITETETLSVTGQEIVTAMQAGTVILMSTNIVDVDPPTEYNFYPLTTYLIRNTEHESPYSFSFGNGGEYYAPSLSDHPQYPDPTSAE